MLFLDFKVGQYSMLLYKIILSTLIKSKDVHNAVLPHTSESEFVKTVRLSEWCDGNSIVACINTFLFIYFKQLKYYTRYYLPIKHCNTYAYVSHNSKALMLPFVCTVNTSLPLVNVCNGVKRANEVVITIERSTFERSYNDPLTTTPSCGDC